MQWTPFPRIRLRTPRLRVSPLLFAFLAWLNVTLAASGGVTDAGTATFADSPIALTTSSGASWTTGDLSRCRIWVIAFLGTECPLGNLYVPELSRLYGEYGPRGVGFLAVNSNRGDDGEKVSRHAKSFGIPFPVLLDPEQRLADQLGATRTPEVVVVNEKGRTYYRGRIDDRFGYVHRRSEPTRRDLEEALAEILAGRPVTYPSTEAVGCLIDRKRSSVERGAVTYAREVSRILQNKCEECHRPGMVAPFSLSGHEEVVKWLGPIREAVAGGRMPPWHADATYGHFANDRRLTAEEQRLILSWLDNGAPLGDLRDLPEPRRFTEGWMIGKPDIVFQMPREVKVPSQGVIPYKYFTVATKFKEDTWIQAAEIRPGNRAVVHHIIVFHRKPAMGVLNPEDLLDGFLVSSAPSDIPLNLPPGVARRIPAGSELVWQVHYTPTGKEESDRSELGLMLYKGKEPPKAEALTMQVSNRRLRIPPGEANFTHHATHLLPQDITILGLCPHMHLRGKDFKIEAIFPGRQREELLWVPRYDFKWNTTYRLATPLHLPRGTKLHAVAHFDNSSGNPNNPDPLREVRWGEQTTDEMMIGWIDYIVGPPLPAAGERASIRR
ncbi:MAG: redoxin family protein [Planctomycetota bacterium]